MRLYALLSISLHTGGSELAHCFRSHKSVFLGFVWEWVGFRGGGGGDISS